MYMLSRKVLCRVYSDTTRKTQLSFRRSRFAGRVKLRCQVLVSRYREATRPNCWKPLRALGTKPQAKVCGGEEAILGTVTILKIGQSAAKALRPLCKDMSKVQRLNGGGRRYRSSTPGRIRYSPASWETLRVYNGRIPTKLVACKIISLCLIRFCYLLL